MTKRNAIRLGFAVIFILALTLLTACSRSYVISFDSDGGTAVESIEIKDEKTIIPPAPTKDGYTFAGWYLDNDKWDFEHYAVNKNITLKAKWLKNYTASFDSQGGSNITSQTVSEGSKLSAPAKPSKEKAEFIGWFIGDTKWNFDEDILTEDITLVAKWKSIYTVSFDSDGGNLVTSQTVKDGEATTAPTEPTRYGYKFAGWYLGNTEWDFKSAVTANIALKAKWIPIYTVSFSTDGAGKIDAQSVISGGFATEPADIQKAGYVFEGWYNGEVKWNFATDKIIGNTELTAKWRKIHTVKFNTTGGSTINSVKIADGEKLEEPEEPTRELYIFNAWYCVDRLWDFENDTVTDDIELVAAWTINFYTISFDTDGAGVIPNQQIVKGNKIVKPENPSKDEYAFAGWYYNGTPWDFNIAPTGNIELKAVWDSNFCTVTFKTNDNNGAVISERVPKSSCVAERTVTKDGYVLDGWFIEGTDTRWNFDNTVDSDITLEARWIKLYTVTFDSNGGIPVDAQNIREGAPVTMPDAPIRTGYRLEGWYCNGELWNFEANRITENITLMANWIRVYTVSFNLNGGSVGNSSSIDSQVLDDNGKVKKPADPQKTGSEFEGWYCDGELWSFDSDTVTSDIELIAKWNDYYYVSFDTDGGEGSFEYQARQKGELASCPTAQPTKTGHTFLGWYLGDNEWDFETDTVTDNITLVAKWEPIIYTVTFNPNGAEDIASQQIAYGQKITKPDDPTRGEEYVFDSWRDESGRIWDFENDVVEGDVVLKAYWTHLGTGSSGGVTGPWDESDNVLGPLDKFE